MQILRVACATLVAALLSFVVAQPARGQCSYLALELFYTVPVAGSPNVMDACAKGTGVFQIVNVSAASNAYPDSSSQLTSNQYSTGEIEVTFEGTNQHLMQSYFINGRWAAVDLSAVTGGTLPVVGSAMTSFADGYGQHVFYIGTDSVVHQMLNSNGSWRSLSVGGSVNPNGSQLTNYVIHSQENIVYEGADGGVDLLSTSNGTTWTASNLTLLSGGTAPDFGTAFTAFWLTNPETAQLIYFVGSNQVHEYSHVNGVWSDQAVRTPFVPVFQTGMNAIDARGSFHVLYLTPNVNTGSEDVIEAWRPYNSNNWTVNNLTPFGQLTPEAISGSSLSGSLNGYTQTFYVAQSTTPSIYVLYTTGFNNGQLQWASQQAVQLPLFESTLLSSFYW